MNKKNIFRISKNENINLYDKLENEYSYIDNNFKNKGKNDNTYNDIQKYIAYITYGGPDGYIVNYTNNMEIDFTGEIPRLARRWWKCSVSLENGLTPFMNLRKNEKLVSSIGSNRVIIGIR